MVLNTKNQDTRYWCEYCRIFVYNNRINREKHEASPQHTANFKKRVETLRREEQELQRNKAVFGGNVKGSEGANANSSFYNKTTAVSSASGSASGIKNVLSIKTATETQTQKKKPILGLGTSENKVNRVKTVVKTDSEPDGSAAAVNLMVKTSNFIDIKTATKDLKRKIIEDEEKSRSLPTTDSNTEQQHVKDQDKEDQEEEEEEEINVEGLFKKKKTKKESS